MATKKTDADVPKVRDHHYARGLRVLGFVEIEGDAVTRVFAIPRLKGVVRLGSFGWFATGLTVSDARNSRGSKFEEYVLEASNLQLPSGFPREAHTAFEEAVRDSNGNFQGRKLSRIGENTIFAEKTFADCSLLPCQRTPRPKFCGENFRV